MDRIMTRVRTLSDAELWAVARLLDDPDLVPECHRPALPAVARVMRGELRRRQARPSILRRSPMVWR